MVDPEMINSYPVRKYTDEQIEKCKNKIALLPSTAYFIFLGDTTLDIKHIYSFAFYLVLYLLECKV